MKPTKVLITLSLSSAIVLGAMATSDPTLMKINGKDVKLSEFEYMYHKNSDQQIQPLSLDEYVDMFVNYKLKVLAAEDAGIDTTAAFIKEFNGYKTDLARPYLKDETVEQDLLKKAYEQAIEEVRVEHIMLPAGVTDEETKQNLARLDSIRNEVLNNGQSFEALCAKFSIDNSSKERGGDQGYIDGQRGLPNEFVEKSYSTKVGEISEPFRTLYGTHIIKVLDRRPASGQVEARHIFKKLMGDYTPEDEAIVKAKMDSLYTLLKNGAEFPEIAMKNSEDGTARNGGNLGWFARAQMIPEFSDVVFDLKNGEISQPFKTRFGYHIAQRLNWKGVGTFEEMKPQLLNSIQGDERSIKAEKAKLEQLKKIYKPTLNDKTFATLADALKANNGLDSTIIKDTSLRKLNAGKVGKKTYTLGDVFNRLPHSAKLLPDAGLNMVKGSANDLLDRGTLDCEKDRLEATNADFRNLVNEYRDGILMFEISNQNVWGKASQDKDGLEKFFQENKQNYSWATPKYKGYIIYATTDSVMNLAKEYLTTNKFDNSELAKVLQSQFPKEVKLEKIVAAKGENAIVDEIAFEVPTKEKPNGRWKYYFGYDGRIISAPEEAADVRGPVTTDYQNYLEKEWIKQLRNKYKVEINKKTLSKVK